MSSSTDLPSADMYALLQLIGDAAEDDPGPALPWALLDGLRALIPCAEIGFNECDFAGHRYVQIQSVDLDDGHVELSDAEPSDSMWFTEFPTFHRRLFPDGQVHAWSERLSLEDLRRETLYEPFWPGMSDTLWIDFPSRPGGYRKLCLWRHNGERFGQRELALMQLLRPHLYELDRLARRRRTGVPQLTPREWQVLELAAEGLGNQQIARALVTSLSTVRKHLEHIYLKTGARGRGAAVAMMMPLHP